MPSSCETTKVLLRMVKSAISVSSSGMSALLAIALYCWMSWTSSPYSFWMRNASAVTTGKHSSRRRSFLVRLK